MDAGPFQLGVLFGKGDTITFDDNINILIRPVHEQVTHKSANHIRAVAEFIRNFTDALECI